MIELMVVVTVIAILLSLTLAVVGGLVSNARDAATKATLSKIQTLLNARAQAFQRLTMRKGYIQSTPEFQMVAAWNKALGVNGVPQSTQQILAMKLLQRRYFPQSFAEVNPGYMSSTPPAGFGVLTQPNLSLANNPQLTQQNVTSSAILYDFLTQEFVVGDVPPGADNFTAAEVKTNQASGLNEFVDAWGNPLRFYRWPTRFFRSGGQTGANTVANITTATGPNPTQANGDGSYDVVNAQLLFSTLPVFSGNLQTDLSRDPDDPLRELLTNITFVESLQGSALATGAAGTPFANGAAPGPAFHTPATFHVFLVVSAGPDGQLGMWEPNDIPNNGHLAAIIPGAEDALTDNIVSLSIKAGGNR